MFKTEFFMKTDQQSNLTVNLTATELAARWRMHPESLRRMARQRRIETIIIAGRRRFPLREVERTEAEGRISRVTFAKMESEAQP